MTCPQFSVYMCSLTKWEPHFFLFSVLCILRDTFLGPLTFLQSPHLCTGSGSGLHSYNPVSNKSNLKIKYNLVLQFPSSENTFYEPNICVYIIFTVLLRQYINFSVFFKMHAAYMTCNFSFPCSRWWWLLGSVTIGAGARHDKCQFNCLVMCNFTK